MFACSTLITLNHEKHKYTIYVNIYVHSKQCLLWPEIKDITSNESIKRTSLELLHWPTATLLLSDLLSFSPFFYTLQICGFSGVTEAWKRSDLVSRSLKRGQRAWEASWPKPTKLVRTFLFTKIIHNSWKPINLDHLAQ